MDKKKCCRCKQEKEISCFGKNSRMEDGISNKCKQCASDYYWDNRDNLLAKNRSKYNKEESVNRVLAWRENKFGHIKKEKQEKRLEKQRLKEEKRLEKEYRKEYITPLIKRIRSLVCGVISKNQLPKDNGNYLYLGCEYDFFKNHIEKQFVKGMDWTNREYWQLDHIIPLSSAKTQEELIPLFHHTNIQPLWADDNKTKGNKIPKLTNLHFMKTYE